MQNDQYRISLAFDGSETIDIGCRPNEDVVAAGLRQGVLIVSDCRRGICGACRAFLAAGHYDELLEHNVHALSPEEEEDGWVLSCRLRPRSDLRLEFDYPVDRIARLDASRRAARVLQSEHGRNGFVRLVVKTAAAQAPIAFTPGQYVLVERAPGKVAYRAFPASTAGSHFEIELFLVMPPRTSVEAAVFAAGEAFIVEGPFGDTAFVPGGGDLLFIAGPDGLAPAAALIHSVSNQRPSGHTTLFFDGERETEPWLRMLVGSEPVLRFGIAGLGERLHRSEAAQLCLCGPPALNAAVRSILADVEAPNVIVSEIKT